MAKLYGDAQGNIIRVITTVEQEKHYGIPEGYVYQIEFDIDTNLDIINGMNTDWNSYDMVGGVLHKNGTPVIVNPPGEYYLAMQEVDTGYPVLPDWARTGTAEQAESYITGQIFNGMTQADVENWIDTNITNITTANVNQINIRLEAIRQGLKLISGAIITMRSLFILTSKLLVYIRDLVIRFRQQ